MPTFKRPAIRINGNTSAFRVSKKSSYDPSKGLTINEEWVRVGGGLDGLANLCRRNGASYELSTSARESRISYTSNSAAGTGVNVSTDTWQVLANEVHKSIFEMKWVTDLPSDGSNGSVAHVREMVQRHENNEPIDTLTGDSYKLYEMLIRGTTEYPVGQYALKHTTNVSADSTGNISDYNVDKLYSTSSLITEIANGGLWTNPCPPRLQAKILGIAVGIADHGDYYWSWRKLPSTETTSANNRIDISTEYWLASWNTKIYGATI